jgi:hypothetical protein
LSPCLLVFLLGCGDANGPELTPVSGKVYFHGQPLTQGTIVFVPDESRGSTGPLARADVQPDGSYHLRTDDATGAVAGWHRVTIAAVAPPVNGAKTAPRPILPDKYREPARSGLSCEITAGHDNAVNFRLE